MNLKSTLISLGVVALLAAPIWIAHLSWRLAPAYRLNLLVVDYSVPTKKYWNHKGLFWLLNHLRVAPPSGEGLWQLDRDYVGFDPLKGTGTRITDVSLAPYDVVYLSDTYGVHVRDRAPEDPADVKNGFLFGGLSDDDARALERFSAQGSIVSEFNSLSDPTPKAARHIVADIMGIEWRGWSGRFVADFSEVPDAYPWFPALFAAQYEKAPLPRGHGMMLISEEGRLLVLHGALFERSMPTLLPTDAGREWIDRPLGTPPYYGWFGVVAAKPGTEVLAEIALPTPKQWEATYREYGLPSRVPLLTRRRTGAGQQIYIAANVSVVDEVPTFHSLAFLPKLLATIHRRRDSQSHGPAFWQFFVPVVGKILTDAATATDAPTAGPR